MAYRVRTVRDVQEFRAAVAAIGHYFGWQPTIEDAERFSRALPLDRLHAVYADGEVVGGAGHFPLELTVPGGRVACAGTTVVGVLPTHRRRGLLTRMMLPALAEARDRGEPVAALWASQETIYGRYGFGLSSLQHFVRADLHRVGVRSGLPHREGQVRLVDTDQALAAFPRLYERVARRTPGLLRRNRMWWEMRALDDDPQRRRGAGPLNRALLELDGRPAGYALYRVAQNDDPADWRKTIRVREAIGVDPVATREIWRFLLEIDWMDTLEAWLLPVDHPLRLVVSRINLLKATLHDALWVRLLDVGVALASRRYRDGAVTIEVASDPQFADNVARWRVSDGAVRRTTRSPDVVLDVEALGSVYLGGFTFAELVAAGRAEEARRGGAARADDVFRTPGAPWCPEIF